MFNYQQKVRKGTVMVNEMVELTFGINNFNRNKNYKAIEALGKQLLNLLIIEPGTYPSCPDMGVGINLYKMEMMNTTTINEIKTKITKQSNKYIPNSDLITEIIVEPMNNLNNTHNNGVYIGFKLTTINEVTKDYDLIIISSGNDINNPSKTITEFHIT